MIKINFRFRDGDGEARSLNLDSGGRVERDGVEISARIDESQERSTVRAIVSNRSGSPVRLDEVRFCLETNFPSQTPARFFKHGYQSWSPSHRVAIGAIEHRRDNANFIIRVNHQSEVRRPPDAPEAATSEQFTIIESESSRERFFAGFIGAAHQLTTTTVNTPDLIIARALLDGVVLASGEGREIEPLVFWRSEESTAQIASRFAAMLGDNMHARVSAPYQRGWCSWYHYFHAITEDAILANVRPLKDLRSEYPLEVVQLDDGYQAALGDWDRTNAKFPSGLKKMADEIRGAGFVAGLWTAPFFAARDSEIMRVHPDWFIRHETGGALRAGYNPNWATGEDKFAYALDPSNPHFAAHLERLFKTIVEDYGYDYLKLDFLYAGAAEGIRHDPKLTRAETLRHGLEAIRRGAGERTFILACGCPLCPAVGIVNGMRIGPDVAPYWGAGAGETGAPGTALAIDAVVARSFMHRRWWLNDPDCLMLRAKETQLSDNEREALALTIAASGGMLLISDDMTLLDEDSAKLFQTVARIGAEVDLASKDEPPLSPDLMTRSPLRILSTRTRDGSLHLILNMSGSPQRIGIAELIPDARDENIELPSHSARIIRS
jgi:alpha-galactosidase